MRNILEWCEASMLTEGDTTDYIDEKKIDLVGEYQKLNKLLFDGRLGAYPMKWNRRKSMAAFVKFKRVKSPSQRQVEIKILNIEVSAFYLQSYEAFRNRLAHEMIHVYWLEKNIVDNHGPGFKAETRRVNSRGFHVTAIEKPEEAGVAFRGGKRFGVIMPIYSTGITVVPEKKVDEWIESMVMAFPLYKFPPNAKFLVMMHDGSWLQEYPNPRVSKSKPKVPQRYGIHKDKRAELMKDGVPYGVIETDSGFTKTNGKMPQGMKR